MAPPVTGWRSLAFGLPMRMGIVGAAAMVALAATACSVVPAQQVKFTPAPNPLTDVMISFQYPRAAFFLLPGQTMLAGSGATADDPGVMSVAAHTEFVTVFRAKAAGHTLVRSNARPSRLMTWDTEVVVIANLGTVSPLGVLKYAPIVRVWRGQRFELAFDNFPNAPPWTLIVTDPDVLSPEAPATITASAIHETILARSAGQSTITVATAECAVTNSCPNGSTDTAWLRWSIWVSELPDPDRERAK